MARVETFRLRRGNLMHFALAWVLCVGGLLLTAATWLPGPSRVPFAAVGVLFVAIFPVFGSALVRALFSEDGRTLLGRAHSGRMWRFVQGLPTGLKWSYAAVFAVLLLAMLTAGGAQDAKSDTDGYYYTRWNNTTLSSERVALRQGEYHKAVKAQTRVFASGATLFHAMSSFLVLVAGPGRAASQRVT
jgi:hypothetical protein